MHITYSHITNNLKYITRLWSLHHKHFLSVLIGRSLTCQDLPLWCQCGAETQYPDLWVLYRSLDLPLVLATWPCLCPFLPVSMTTEVAAGCQKASCGFCTTLPRGCCLWKNVPVKAPCFPEGRKYKHDNESEVHENDLILFITDGVWEKYESVWIRREKCNECQVSIQIKFYCGQEHKKHISYFKEYTEQSKSHFNTMRRKCIKGSIK